MARGAGISTITDNATGSPHTLALSGTGPDFTLAVASGSSSSATVSPGSAASYSLSLGGNLGFSGTVSMACTGAPSLASCSISPQSPGVSGSTPTTETVTIATTASSNTIRVNPDLPPSGVGLPNIPPVVTIAAALILLLVMWGFGRRTRAALAQSRVMLLPQPRVLAWAGLSLAIMAILAFVACGGGSAGGGGGGGFHNPGTPAGTYTLTITGSTPSGGATLQHAVTLKLTVQ